MLMGLRFKFNLLPSLLPEEKVLFFKQQVWILFVKSLPTYRLNISLPPLVEVGLYITDKRILLVIYSFRIFAQEFSQWFEGRGTSADNEFIKEVKVGKSWLWGPYLEVVSDGSKAWYRGTQFRMRLFMRNPEPVRQIIAEEMMRNNL